jgi:hypothetical protein
MKPARRQAGVRVEQLRSLNATALEHARATWMKRAPRRYCIEPWHGAVNLGEALEVRFKVGD